MRENVPSGNQTRRAPIRADFQGGSRVGDAGRGIGSAHENSAEPAQKGAGDKLARKLLFCDKGKLAGAYRGHDHPIKITRMIGDDDRIGLGQRRVGLDVNKDSRQAKTASRPR